MGSQTTKGTKVHRLYRLSRFQKLETLVQSEVKESAFKNASCTCSMRRKCYFQNHYLIVMNNDSLTRIIKKIPLLNLVLTCVKISQNKYGFSRVKCAPGFLRFKENFLRIARIRTKYYCAQVAMFNNTLGGKIVFSLWKETFPGNTSLHFP